VNTNTVGKQGRGGVQRHVGAAALAAVLVVTLAIVPSASATPGPTASAVATVAPIDSATTGNYLLTVTNTGEQQIQYFIFSGGNGAAIAPSTCTYNQPIAGAIGCPAIAPGSSMQVCYSGESASQVTPFFPEAPVAPFAPALVGTVGSCPVAGFNPPAKTVPGAGGESGKGVSTPAPSFTLGKAKAHTKNGTATLSVNVPAAGKVKLSGKGIKGSTVNAKAAGAVTLTVKASGKAAQKLAKTGKVQVKVSVTFTPAGGSPATHSKTVTLTKS
jgi:hypothetical protein